MFDNSIYGFKIIESIRKDRSIQTNKIKLFNGNICVAKSFYQSYCIQENEQMTFMINLNAICKLKYPSLLPLDGYNLRNYEKLLYPIIFTQYLPNGSLEDFLDTSKQNKRQINWTKTDDYITLLGISLGLNYLHANNIVHQNIKLSNILLDDKYRPIICDIDLFNQTPTIFTKSYDICCFAQIIYILITNKRPPINYSEIPDRSVQSFIIRCLSDDIENVPSSEEVLHFMITKPFRDLFGLIDMNKVIQYLNFYHENETDGEDFTVHGMLIFEEDRENTLNLFKRGAERGSEKCAFQYASIISMDNGQIISNKEEIIQYFEKSIDKGNEIAMYLCACFIYQNFQSKELIEKANRYFQMAAERGHVLACHRYGVILYDLNRKEEAARYFKEAADKGNDKSMHNYAMMLMEGDQIETNIEEAILYFQKAIQCNNIDSMNCYGCFLMNSKNDEDKKLAVQYFRTASENDNTYAMCNYAYMCQVGQGIEKNLEEAKSYYLRSIEKGNSKAMNLYGRIIELNNEINKEKAEYYYKMAAEKGSKKAMNNLISLIMKGYQIEISNDEMIYYCKTAADKEKLNSMLFYSKLLFNGQFVAMNKENAYSYLQKAIEKGSIDAMIQYGDDLNSECSSKCIDYYIMAVNKGSVQALNNLVDAIKKYKNCINDEDKKYYYRLAADEGNAYAMYKYGSMLFKNNCLLLQSAKYLWKAIKAQPSNKKAIDLYLRILEEYEIEPISRDEIENTRFLKMAAETNNLFAMVQYGLRLKDGIGTKININEALRYVQTAAEAGHPLGMETYAIFLESAICTDSNIEEAKKYYLMAIEKGLTSSLYHYSFFLRKHFPDSEEIDKYFKEAVSRGYNEAIYSYAYLFDEDIDNKLKYLKIAADNGHIKSMYKYALYLYKNKEFNDYKEIIRKYFCKAAIKGHSKSMCYYAEILEKLCPNNLSLIQYYYQESIIKGDLYCIYEYGKFLQRYDYVFHNINVAVELIKRAADRGHKKATKEITKMILSNKYIIEDKEELSSYLKKAADNHNINAMYKYGCMLKTGDGIPIDYEEGLRYIKNAADEGFIDAMSDYTFESIAKNGFVNYGFDHFEEESRKYQQILLDFKADNTKVFVDENFPPFQNWKRVDEIYPAPLFKKDLIDPDYIVQGEIGDCYLISSLSRISKQYYLVSQLFERYLPNLILGAVEDSINIKCGAVVIYFYAFGHRTPVLIDTLLPMSKGKPLFSHLSDDTKSPWFCLVEKAFAKLCGSFSNIISGMASNAIYYLFFYYSKILLKSYLNDNSTAFQKIMKYQGKGYLIETAISNINDSIDGLATKHSYFLLKAREAKNEKFICLRNPWGTDEFNGKYARDSSNWTPELKKLLGYDKCQEGSFFMTNEEFFKYFNSFVIMKPVHPEWYVKKYCCQFLPGMHDGVEINYRTADLSNHQTFAFQITDNNIPKGQKCHLRLIVERSKSTFYHQINNNQTRSKYCLILAFNNVQKLDSNINLSESNYKYFESILNVQTFSIDVTNNDIITILFHRLEKQNYIENCYVSVICDFKFKLYDIDFPNQEIPYSENPGIVFDNFTISFPNISKPLVMSYWENRFVLTFSTSTLNDNINQDEFDKMFQYANKNVGSSHLNLDDFTRESDAINHGTNGRIYIVKEKKTQMLYAAKIGNTKITSTKGFLRELTILRSIKYPSIINFKGFIEKDFIDQQFPTIIMEYLQMSSLSEILKNEHFGLFNSEELKKWNLTKRWTRTKKMINIIGIALGMDYLHRHNIIHRDLKFQNVLLDDDLYPKICDFGDSKFLELESGKMITQYVGTHLFMAPEVRSGKTYSYPVDVYSFGIMAYFIYSNQVPLNINCSINFDFLDSKYHSFISNMVNEDPEKRPAFHQIIDSLLTNREETWIDGVDENEIELYLHKFGLSIKPKKQKINFDIIESINEENYPENAKNSKIEIQQIIENHSIPQQIKDKILIAESFINSNSINYNNDMNEISNVLFEVGQLFYLGNKESIFNIQEDYFHAIKYLKAASLFKHEQAIDLLAYLYASDSKQESHKCAFQIAKLASDLDYVNGFYNLGVFYAYGIGVKSNIVMSAINYKISADRGDVSSMMEYANALMNIGEHKFDHEKLKEQIKEAEIIVFNDEGKKNYIYNEARLTIEALENEYVALYVSERYFQKAMNKGNKEAEQKYLLIKKNNGNNNYHPQYYDDLFLSLHNDSVI